MIAHRPTRSRDADARPRPPGQARRSSSPGLDWSRAAARAAATECGRPVSTFEAAMGLHPILERLRALHAGPLPAPGAADGQVDSAPGSAFAAQGRRPVEDLRVHVQEWGALAAPLTADAAALEWPAGQREALLREVATALVE